MKQFALTFTTYLLFLSTNAFAHDKGDILIRAGFATVAPDASSSALVLDGAAISGSSADVDDNTQFGLTLAYMLTDKVAIELLASTPFKHDISATTGALGLGGIAAGDTKHLPPTLSLLYFPMGSSSRFQPYVGAGLNHTVFFEEGVSSQLEGVLGNGSLELDASTGLALQLGFDYQFGDKVFLNGSVWWADIDTKADFEFDNNRLTTSVEIDPIVYKLSIGRRL